MIVPSFNSGAYVASALESVLPQLDAFDEVIVQDGGSTDETATVVQEIAARDSRLIFVQEKDSGQSDALNRALARASKRYILWLNADDIVFPGAIATLKATAMEPSSSPDFVYGMHKLIDAHDAVISVHDPKSFTKAGLLLRGCYVFSGSFLVRRELLVSIGGFATDLHYCMDLDVLLRIAAVPTLVTQKVPVYVGALRWHEASKSGGQAKNFVREGWNVRQRFYASPLDAATGALAAVIQSASIATTSLRHSKIYQRLRGRTIG